jgi:hypothetical protein
VELETLWKVCSRTVVVSLLAFGGYRAAVSSDYFSKITPERDYEWGQKIAKGGYILHFRHAQREKWTDVTAFDAIELLKGYNPETIPFKRATCLTERGMHEAKLIGSVFEATNVKVDQIISSPSCRSVQTAQLAFGRIDSIANSLLHRTAMVDRQHLEFNKDLRKRILDLKPAAGKNAVLSGHGGTLRLDSGVVVDVNETGEGLDERDETGFVVLEVVGDKVIARYKFRSIFKFANAMIELPVSRDQAGIASATSPVANAQ